MGNHPVVGGDNPTTKPKPRIPVYTPPPVHVSPNPRGGTGAGGTNGSGGGSSGGSDSVASAQARQDAKESKAKSDAARRARETAHTLQAQADSLIKALSAKGFKHALDLKLANVDLVQRQADALLVRNYTERVDGLHGQATDNDKAEAGASYQNITNRSRERLNAITEAMSQGAGESDTLKAQLMSLNNWEQNQNGINRSYFDTGRSINNSLHDVTIDTRTARVNNVVTANNSREQLWSDYFNQRSETYTQLGNVYGQQAEQYGLAREQSDSKKDKQREHRRDRLSHEAFDDAADQSGKAWKNPGVSSSLRAWKGAGDIESQLNNSQFSDRTDNDALPKKPEGAKLRKWA